jgi:hypothetical protein
MRREGLLGLDEMIIDGSHLRSLKGGPCRPLAGRPGTAWVQAPPDRGHQRHPAAGVPDWREPVRREPLLPLVDSLPAIRGVVGRPRRKPKVLFADRGYDYDKYRRELRERGITPMIARAESRTVPGSARSAGSSNVASPGSTSSNVSIPLRGPRRPPPRTHAPGMRHHLLAQTPGQPF